MSFYFLLVLAKKKIINFFTHFLDFILLLSVFITSCMRQYNFFCYYSWEIPEDHRFHGFIQKKKSYSHCRLCFSTLMLRLKIRNSPLCQFNSVRKMKKKTGKIYNRTKMQHTHTHIYCHRYITCMNLNYALRSPQNFVKNFTLRKKNGE